jgi:hypothetical protein
MLVKPPEHGASFALHQDYPYFPHERHSVVAASIHLDDADEENGCLRVVPGSQRLGPLEAHGPSTNRSSRTRRNVLFQYRDPADPPVLVDGVEAHVNWGQGMMAAGHNPCYWERRPRFEVKAA